MKCNSVCYDERLCNIKNDDNSDTCPCNICIVQLVCIEPCIKFMNFRYKPTNPIRINCEHEM